MPPMSPCWRPPLGCRPRAAAFRRDVIAAVDMRGGERAKELLGAAGKIARLAAGGAEAVPEVLSTGRWNGRFTRCAPGLYGRGGEASGATKLVQRRRVGRMLLFRPDLPLRGNA